MSGDLAALSAAWESEALVSLTANTDPLRALAALEKPRKTASSGSFKWP